MEAHLTNFLSTMTALSFSSDTGRSMVVDDTTTAISLDALARQTKKIRGNQTPATCDVLYESPDGIIYLIEFKDQPAKNIKYREIHRKIYDSMALLLMRVKRTDSIDAVASRSELYIVYQEDASDEAFRKLPRAVHRWIDADSSSPIEPIRFGLLDEHKSYFKRIFTIPISDFLKEHYHCIFQ